MGNACQKNSVKLEFNFKIINCADFLTTNYYWKHFWHLFFIVRWGKIISVGGGNVKVMKILKYKSLKMVNINTCLHLKNYFNFHSQKGLDKSD